MKFVGFEHFSQREKLAVGRGPPSGGGPLPWYIRHDG